MVCTKEELIMYMQQNLIGQRGSSWTFGTAEIATTLLQEDSETSVLEFLEQRPLHTAMMAGLVRDNGLRHQFNRGNFFGCHNRFGELEGVALVGHATLFESRTDRALKQLADVAQACTMTHMIMGEQKPLDSFLESYTEQQKGQSRYCREHLLELRLPVEIRNEVPQLRLATVDDLSLIAPIHAQMAFEESGVDPLKRDPEGFHKRYACRIERNRTWVWIDDGKPIFKADLISDTPRVAYLEGIWVNPDSRGQGQGTDCLLQLAKSLLVNSDALCVFVNEQNQSALRFYQRAGFRDRGVFDTIFLQRN